MPGLSIKNSRGDQDRNSARHRSAPHRHEGLLMGITCWRLTAATLIVGFLLGSWPLGQALGQVDFKGKSITMLIGSDPGGGTDASGRLVAPFLAKHLPGQPTVVVRNMPGADGMTAL